VRIAAAVEILRAWIGEQLWVGPTEPDREAEAYWFTEGVTRHLARDLLFRFGLLSPAELLDEMHGLAAIAATSPGRALGNRDLAARARDSGSLPLLVARGALYAARTDALLRRTPAAEGSSARPRSLADVLRALLVDARARRGPLPTSAWIEALSAALGPGEADAFRAHIERGVPAILPDGALGPCFRSAHRSYEAFDLGFDLEASRLSPARTLVALRPGGPAERAGARAGDTLAGADFTLGRADRPATLTLERGGDRITVRYRPAGARGQGQGWSRAQGIPDAACAQ
jgi:predicted metalloprotease with PDZ domain